MSVNPTESHSPSLFTIDQLSDHLAIPVKTLRQWVYLGRIPNIKLNGLVRFDRRAIDQWIQASARRNQA